MMQQCWLWLDRLRHSAPWGRLSREIAGFQADRNTGNKKLLGGVSAGALDDLKTVLLLVAMPLMSAGFSLVYIIPFLSIITWIQLVASYLPTTVELCIASLLAIILIVTPEGDGISGARLERVMQLIARAILKPSLLIIGLIASITLCYVSFGMMNLFF
ncbi:hypothetical protein ACEUAC_06365 [Aeromonas veronii]